MSSPQHSAVLQHSVGAPLEIGKRATPTPGPGQVLVRNKAVAVNPVEALIQKTGFILGAYGWPIVLGHDGAGEIAALGEGVSGLEAGDKVFYQSSVEPDRGTFQELTIADAARVARVPENFSYEQVVTVPLTVATVALAAYKPRSEKLRKDQHDVGGAGLTPPWEAEGRGKYAGQAALIISGSSSVGQYAIQLAKLSGFSPIITTASKHNEAYCKEAGSTHVIDYRDVPYAELPAAVAKIVGEKPVKYVYDAVSSPETQKAGWGVLAPGGAIVIVTLLSEHVPKPGKDDEKGRRVVWVYGGANEADHAEFAAGMYAALPDLLVKGELKPNRVEIVGHGLEAIPGGVEKIAKGVSGVKLVVTL